MYTHKVQYYETDQMGITHHSNYIRWMEEARVDYLTKIGYGYEKMEKEGMISPVVSVECNYKKTTTFPEEITIDVWVEEFKGVKLKLAYTMTNSKGEVVCEAKSSHGFIDENGALIRIKRDYPEFYAEMEKLVRK